jgi:hypothetical protein
MITETRKVASLLPFFLLPCEDTAGKPSSESRSWLLGLGLPRLFNLKK